MANETITGKIFTLKDPTGTYNRFPRTVMEAVYGLNTYLQNQISSLADIYMPIDGITESKPLQEFVYRLCPSSIKAKSLTLDRIYGKTLAWNQLVNFWDTTGSSEFYGVTYTGTDEGIVVNGTATAQDIVHLSGVFVAKNLELPLGHKILVFLNKKRYQFRLSDEIIDSLFGNNGVGIFTNNLTGLAHIQISLNLGETANNELVKCNVVDLTLLYGSEIDGMTDAEILAKFESEYPGYHEAGNKLISNDAESIETVGFNLCDEEFELGSYSNYGDKVSLGTKVRNKNPIKVVPGETYYYKCPVSCNIFFFGADGKTLVGRQTVSPDDWDKNHPTPQALYWPANTEAEIPDDVYYIGFSTFGDSYTDPSMLSGVFCINLSDPAKNGTYEPYRKSTMRLGLGSFQVRDSQGNVTTITGGLKSAGSVKDEIVGNKYIKRVGSVDLGSLAWSLNETYGFVATPSPTIKAEFSAICSKYIFKGAYIYVVEKSCGFIFNTGFLVKDSTYNNAAEFKTAMSGVMLYYELATPIEYELVSPLVPTVKAGITEARISPNSDGLSAPMVADMTYDAQANNDSASAQYALTAGRLLNSHKLWGQDFDGTQDVAGALTGVTNLNSLLYFGSNNIGIGTVSPQYKLDVAGTFRATGAATLGDTLTVTGNTTLNSDLIVYDDAFFHSDMYLYSGMALYLDQSGNNALYYDASEGTIRFVFDYASHFSDGLYSDSFITAGGVNSSSDARLKNDITSVVDAMDTIMALKPSEWIWNEKHYLNGEKGAGLVAQEVEKVLPFAVSHDTEFLSLNYNVFHAYEIAAIQELVKEVKELKAKVEQLKMR